MVVANDFIVGLMERGSRFTNQRGQILLERVAILDVDLANVGTKGTFIRNGAESIIDVTFYSPGLISSSNWRVDDSYTHSDHLAVRYSVDYNNSKQRVEEEAVRPRPSPRSWKTLYFDEGIATQAIADLRRVLSTSYAADAASTN